MSTLNLGPATLNLRLYAGDTPNFPIDLPLDITGGAVGLQIRSHHGASPAIVSLDSTNGGLTVTPLTPTATQSRVRLRPLTRTEEAAIQALPREAVWDLQTVIGGVTQTWLAGTITIAHDVTRGTP